MPEIRVQLEEDDYVEAGQAAAKPTRRILVAVVVVSLWFGVFFGARIGQILYIPMKQGKFGKEIPFQQAGFSVNPFAKSAIAEDLMVRVESARCRY